MAGEGAGQHIYFISITHLHRTFHYFPVFTHVSSFPLLRRTTLRLPI